MPITPPAAPPAAAIQYSALDIISSALRLINVLGSGEQPQDGETADALMILNQMIDSWNAEKLMIYTVNIENFSLTPGTQTYTMGPGGVFNTNRPARIERANIVSLSNPSQPLELPLEMLTDAEWSEIPVKNIQSSLPQKLYDDGAFPLRNLSFWCIPNAAAQVNIYSWQQLTQYTNPATKQAFPPAYLKALRYCLAVDLAPEFGKEVPASVAVQAVLEKAKIKSLNIVPITLSCDDALMGGGGKYDWRSDTYK